MKELIQTLLEDSFRECMQEGVFCSCALPRYTIEVPKNKEHGDFATNLAMPLAKQVKKSPRDIAGYLVARIRDPRQMFEQIDIAGPGFINFHFRQDAWHRALQEIADSGERFGSSDMGRGAPVIVEYVSANPTGPLHVGHGRGAAVGDSVARILSHAGYSVTREYYVNDAGNQIHNLGKAVYYRYLQQFRSDVVFPDGLYRGDYVSDIAADIARREGDRYLGMPENETIVQLSRIASGQILQQIKDDLERFGIAIDSWFSEQSLFEGGDVSGGITSFKEQGLAYEKDGAVWFAASRFGDEKDRVVVKEDGSPTYFASDISYHQNKMRRGFQKMINVWGADHHGYVPRLRSVLSALDIPPDAFEVILVQMVNLYRDGQPVAMSTRAGEFVTLREVVDEVGSDAARFIFLTRRSDAQLDFDLDVAKKQSDENPVYYVQYAHARICSIIDFAGQNELSVPEYAEIDPALLSTEEDIDLIKKMYQFQWAVSGSARALEPHRIAVYLMELVGQFHRYYSKHRVITDDRQLSSARLYLMHAIKSVLKTGLSLIGVHAPEKM